jgi:hypothetical protein
MSVRRYPNNYDAETSERWIREVVLRTPLLYSAWRTDDAFLIALLSLNPWLPNDIECHVVVTCADFGHVWQTVPLLKHSIKWAKERKAVSWTFYSDTEHDIAPLMKRIGARMMTRWRVDLGEADGLKSDRSVEQPGR